MFSFLQPTFLIAILIALSVHEAAHAWMAYQLGDDTARLSGRMTLNPIAHLDLLGTILFLTVGFGWGKPVPVNPYAFKHPKRDTALVALAGPVSNLILAIICFSLLMFISPGSVNGASWDLLSQSAVGSAIQNFLDQLLSASLFLNLGLMAFNLLPIAPLDGSKIIGLIIPYRYDDVYQRYLRYGPYILLALLLGENVLRIPLLTGWISVIMDSILRVLLAVVGR